MAKENRERNVTDINIRFDWQSTRRVVIEVPEGFVLNGIDRGYVERLKDGSIDFAFALNAITEEAASFDNLRITHIRSDDERQH